MGRKQRRKCLKVQRTRPQKAYKKIQKQEEADFSSVPLATMCQSIQLLIMELYKRGYPIFDFDNKTKFVQGIKIIRGKIFFLMAENVGCQSCITTSMNIPESGDSQKI